MSEFNFDKLKNIEVPDTWVDKALNVSPKTDKPPIFFVNFRRVAAAVVCLLVICVVCLSPLFFRNNNDLLPVSPSNKKNNESQSENFNTQPPTVVETTEIESVKNDTQAYEPTQSVEPTENISGNPNDGASTPSQKPSDDIEDKEPTTTPNNGSQNEPPSLEPNGPVAGTEFLVSFDPMWFLGDFDIYCRVYDSNGNLMGDSDLYSESHKTYIVKEPSFEYSSMGEESVGYYNVSNSGIDYTDDIYYLYFYSKSHGDKIIFSIERGIDY